VTLKLSNLTEEQRPLVKPWRKLEDNIKMELQEVRWGGMDWVGLAQDTDSWRKLANVGMYLLVP
jgi:hypothetical protein